LEKSNFFKKRTDLEGFGHLLSKPTAQIKLYKSQQCGMASG
jgi:hypothetical protein